MNVSNITCMKDDAGETVSHDFPWCQLDVSRFALS